MSRAILPCARGTLALASLITAVTLAGLASAAEAKKPAPPVHIFGTAYAFDNQAPIAGATVRVLELPGVTAETGADGRYDLELPDGRKVTPFIEATGYHGIYLQTFVTAGKDLERVNFQVPSDGIYLGLAAILGVELDADGNPAQCAVVSTFSTVNVRDLSFDDFVAYGAHGVAGATASGTPAVSDPTYFNSSVIPDASLTESSVDGGVIWLDVPKGVYTFRAQHPTERFASFRATCAAGRLVNANPPQGLYQLRDDETVDKKVAASLASARFRDPQSGAPSLRLRLKAGEYVSVGARLRRAGRGVGQGRLGRYDDGLRVLSVPVRRNLAGRTLKLRIALKDALGNRKLIRRQLRVPLS